MKRPAWRLLSGCLIAALAACTGSAATPARSPTRPAPVTVTSAATGASPAPSPPAATPSVVAVVTGYYQAILARNYRKAFGYLAPGATGPDGRRMTLASFLRLAQMLDGMGGPVTRFSIGGFPSEVVMTLYRVRYGPYHAHLGMAGPGTAGRSPPLTGYETAPSAACQRPSFNSAAYRSRYSGQPSAPSTPPGDGFPPRAVPVEAPVLELDRVRPGSSAKSGTSTSLVWA